MKVLLATCLWATALLPAQRLYNEAQDRRAQEAVAASAQIRDSSVFQKALDNLALVQRLQQENIALGAQAQTRADVLSWTNWADVRSTVEAVRSDLAADPLGAPDKAEWAAIIPRLQQQQKDLAEQIKALKQKIESSNPEGNVQALGNLLAQVGRITPIAEYLLNLTSDGNPSKAHLAAAKQASETLTQLATLYQKFTANIPARPGVLFAAYQLDLLKAEEEHYKALIAIEARRQAEVAPIVKLSAKVLQAIDTQQLQGDIQTSLRDQAQAVASETDATQKLAKREKLGIMLTALLNAATVAARGILPSSLSTQRETLQVRAHALSRSRKAASVYEQLAATGTQRLSAYYKGGIRPRTLAELLHTLVSAGLIPAVLQR